MFSSTSHNFGAHESPNIMHDGIFLASIVWV